MNFEKGDLVHYNIYQKLNVISLRTFICTRRAAICQFSENFFGTTSRKCEETSELPTAEMCLEMGTTRYSVDGKLKELSPHLYATNNKIQSEYHWLMTKTDVKWNSIVEFHIAETNGTHVLSNFETDGSCIYEKGSCSLKDKIMVWRTNCFYNLQFLRSEICHRKNRSIYCSESDFDQKDQVEVCGLKYINTNQGIMFSVNGTKESFKKHYMLNAAVIQHLEKRIEILESYIMCVAHVDVLFHVNHR